MYQVQFTFMKKITVLLLLLCGFIVFAQTTYTVQPKDTPYGISRAHGMTVDEFYRLNPTAQQGLKIGDVVLIAKGGKAAAATQESTGTIVIQPKQTLYGISHQYNVSIADIQKLNPGLGESLSIGQELILPAANIKKFGGEIAATPSVAVQPTNAVEGVNTYLIQPKDTYYGITHKFGISQEDLYALNPGLQEKGLHPGDIINVRKTKASNGRVVMDDDRSNASVQNNVPIQSTQPTSYTVQPGDTIFKIVNRFGVSLDQLLADNPELVNGLKTGMVLKINQPNAGVRPAGAPLNVTLLLPFGFDSQDAKYRDIALDFLTGAKLAIEQNAGQGQKLNIKVVDEGNETSFNKVLSNINRSNTDLVIGPFFKSDLESLMAYLSTNKIPVVSPFANAPDLMKYSNLIIANTDPSTFANQIAQEVRTAYNGEKIYILTQGDDTVYANQIQNFLKRNLNNPDIKIVQSANQILADKNLVTGQQVPIIAILATNDTDSKSAFVKRMIVLGDEFTGNKAFSMFYSTDFDTDEADLHSTSLVYIIDRKINPDGVFEKKILAAYQAKYCKSPSKYAVIGFDVTNDILTREQANGSLYDALGTEHTQLATKFVYKQSQPGGAYINTGFRVVKLEQ